MGVRIQIVPLRPMCLSVVEIDRQNVIGAVSTRGTIDHLIQVTDFRAQTAVRLVLPSKSDKDTILVESGDGPPIGIVEMKEDFIPGHETEAW